jgi:hypothetical protein
MLKIRHTRPIEIATKDVRLPGKRMKAASVVGDVWLRERWSAYSDSRLKQFIVR